MRPIRLALATTLCLAVPAFAAAAAPSAAPSTATTPATTPAAPVDPMDAAQREALNKAEAEKAQQQVDENTARVMTNSDEAQKHADAVKAYEAAKAQYDAQVKAYEVALTKWKADVAACTAGDRTRCAQPLAKP